MASKKGAEPKRLLLQEPRADEAVSSRQKNRGIPSKTDGRIP